MHNRQTLLFIYRAHFFHHGANITLHGFRKMCVFVIFWLLLVLIPTSYNSWGTPVSQMSGHRWIPILTEVKASSCIYSTVKEKLWQDGSWASRRCHDSISVTRADSTDWYYCSFSGLLSKAEKTNLFYAPSPRHQQICCTSTDRILSPLTSELTGGSGGGSGGVMLLFYFLQITAGLNLHSFSRLKSELR